MYLDTTITKRKAAHVGGGLWNIFRDYCVLVVDMMTCAKCTQPFGRSKKAGSCTHARRMLPRICRATHPLFYDSIMLFHSNASLQTACNATAVDLPAQANFVRCARIT